jgi:alpha-L-glutamate ligase-like protein
MLVAFLMHRVLEKARLLKIPRLAAVITVVTIAFLSLIAAMDLTENRLELGIVALFPVVIIAFTAERLQHMVEDNHWVDAVKSSVGTVLLILLCYLLFSSLLLRGSFALFPALFVIVLGLQVFIGRWTGVRVGEFWRFSKIIRGGQGQVMGMNARNRDWVMAKNDKQWMQVANDKLETKARLQDLHVPVPKTLARYDNRLDCQHLDRDIQSLDCFVVKPNKGSRGQGILVITGKHQDQWFDASGRRLSAANIGRHVQEILAGTFSSMGCSDQAFIEPLIRQAPELDKVAALGLSDIRVVLSDGQPLACMWRVPTRDSDGKANLHQGAVGVAIDTKMGLSIRAERNGKVIDVHPDTGVSLLNVQLPYWQEIVAMSKRCYRAIPLAYLGVDVCIDAEAGPIVLEVNARPGLEIQNVKGRGLQDLFLQFEKTQFEQSPARTQYREGENLSSGILLTGQERPT